MHAILITPAESLGARIARFSRNYSLPRLTARSASHHLLSRPAQRSCTLRPAHSPSHQRDPLHRRLQSPIHSRLLQLLPAGAIIAGWGSHPLEDRAFARRTVSLNSSLKKVLPSPQTAPYKTGRSPPPEPDLARPVSQLLRLHERRRRNHRAAEFHGREHRLPQARHIPQHQEQAISSL